MCSIIDFFQGKLSAGNGTRISARVQERKKTRDHQWKEEVSAHFVSNKESTPEEIMQLTERDKQYVSRNANENPVDMRLGLDVENAHSLLPDNERIILPVYTRRDDVLGDYEVDATRAIERWNNDIVRVYRVFNDVSGEALPILATETEEAAYRAAEA